MLTSQANDFVVNVVETRIHGRFLQRVGDRDRLLVGFHGYGENAEKHLAELRRIPGIERWSLAAVQALHPFYTRSNEVVANWMTSQDRELAIADNVEYVRRVIRTLGPAAKLVFLGFSQGVAMAWRAAADVPSAGVITLDGDVPPDVAVAGVRLPPALVARGLRDEWYTDEKFRKDVRFLESVTRVTPIELDAAHEWTDEFRVAAGEFLQGL